MTDLVQFNLLAGWTSMIAGAVSGAAIGLFFHNETWLGGYASLRRRMLRLGHISFFGLGIINVLFALTLTVMPVLPSLGRWASIGFAAALVMMPLCCFLTAWRPAFRVLFPIPVAGVLLGIVGLLGGSVWR
ncbi:MAG: hypothetical protein JJE51_06670 [Thermoanaerobaculia bacterium]|nr:hypothetical protein [Thermoanaerobaculia bacterium]